MPITCTPTHPLLPPAGRSTRSAPRPLLLTAAGRFDREAIMRLAHSIARDDVAGAAQQGWTRPYKIALRDALASVWITARTQRDCAVRDAARAALPAPHAAILAERTSALMIDSTHRMVVELAAIDARAAAMGLLL